MTSRLFRIADSMKTEFKKGISACPQYPEAGIGLGYTISRDVTDGRPPHVWCHNLQNEASAVYATAGMVTYGCIANLDHREGDIPDPARFKKAVALGNRVSPYFAGMRPVRWAAIHLSEYGRDHGAPAWKSALAGAFIALSRQRLPAGIISDSQLEEGRLAGYDVLFLPTPRHLTDRMRSVIARFKKDGGTVIETQESWQWGDTEGGQAKAAAGLMARLGRKTAKAPIHVSGGPEKMHAVAFSSRDGSRLTVALCNTFSWVFIGRTRKLSPEQKAKLLNVKPPPPCRGVRVLVRGRGRPKKVFDAVTGKALECAKTGGRFQISVPQFDAMAVVVAEY